MTTTSTSATCPWYRRWFHRRFRRTDQQFMIPAILQAAKNKPVTERDPYILIRVFSKFCHQRGQEHWLCPCAYEDRARVELDLYDHPDMRPREM